MSEELQSRLAIFLEKFDISIEKFKSDKSIRYDYLEWIGKMKDKYLKEKQSVAILDDDDFDEFLKNNDVAPFFKGLILPINTITSGMR